MQYESTHTAECVCVCLATCESLIWDILLKCLISARLFDCLTLQCYFSSIFMLLQCLLSGQGASVICMDPSLSYSQYCESDWLVNTSMKSTLLTVDWLSPTEKERTAQRSVKMIRDALYSVNVTWDVLQGSRIRIAWGLCYRVSGQLKEQLYVLLGQCFLKLFFDNTHTVFSLQT